MKAGNKKTYKVPVDREWFLKVLQERNCSIRQLGAVPEIERTEKTIRRSLKKGEMAPDLLVRIAKHLNVHPDYLAGVYAKSLASVENTYIRAHMLSSLRAERFPYLRKSMEDISYTALFETILLSEGISMEQFRMLPPEERVLLRQEMPAAILQVLCRHFKTNALGEDLLDRLDYCQAMVGDDDPTAYFAQLEGIGISEDDLVPPGGAPRP